MRFIFEVKRQKAFPLGGENLDNFRRVGTLLVAQLKLCQARRPLSALRATLVWRKLSAAEETEKFELLRIQGTDVFTFDVVLFDFIYRPTGKFFRFENSENG